MFDFGLLTVALELQVSPDAEKMDTITKLGNLVHKFVEEFDELRNERDSVLRKTVDLETELKKSREIAGNEQGNVASEQAPTEDKQEFENKKNDIIEQINYIIESIDNLDIEDITNV